MLIANSTVRSLISGIHISVPARLWRLAPDIDLGRGRFKIFSIDSFEVQYPCAGEQENILCPLGDNPSCPNSSPTVSSSIPTTHSRLMPGTLPMYFTTPTLPRFR